MKKTKIKTIDVVVKEWFDKTYGNSYFGGNITINYGMKSSEIIPIPFQYGYGDHYRHIAFSLLQSNGYIPNNLDMGERGWRYYEQNNIIARHTKYENCLKREVIAFCE